MIERLDMEEKYNATEAAIHMNRYEIAHQYCEGKKILDISCGEGYGSYLLSKWGSKEVIGIDISDEAIRKANKNFKNENLKYIVQDATKLTELEDNYFDLIVSFETFEHIKKCDEYLKEVKRVAKKDATIIISCPNDYYYYPNESEHNPFHMRKYTFDDFKKKTERVLGNNVSYMAGMELMGYSNIVLDNKNIEKNKDMIDEEKEIDCIKIHSGINHDYSLCNYYIGIWNAKTVNENCVVYPHMYTDWKEAVDILKKDNDELKNLIHELEKENQKTKSVNKLLISKNEEVQKFSGITYNDYLQVKEELDWILQSRSYRLARKLSKLVNLVKRK